jgi:hypothetical protein
MSLSPPKERHDEIVPKIFGFLGTYFSLFLINSAHLIVFRQNINAIIFNIFNEKFIR